jgi:RNase adapter protein RapZ
MRLIIISGRSGSGKSIALHVLEDLGFYCIDNLPLGLLPALIEQTDATQRDYAISIDARNILTDLAHFNTTLSLLKIKIPNPAIYFFDADDHTLLKRYSETRRKHPLSNDEITLNEALQQERILLQPIAEVADLHIDTSHLTIHQLRDIIQTRNQHFVGANLSLTFISFGYKFGIPLDADFIFDVRCLPNPHWQNDLKTCSGLDTKVIKFLQMQPLTLEMLNDLKDYLARWIPHFIADNRSYMTIGIGCTGGQHRSVFIAEQLAQYFHQNYPHVQVRHRELQ